MISVLGGFNLADLVLHSCCCQSWAIELVVISVLWRWLVEFWAGGVYGCSWLSFILYFVEYFDICFSLLLRFLDLEFVGELGDCGCGELGDCGYLVVFVLSCILGDRRSSWLWQWL